MLLETGTLDVTRQLSDAFTWHSFFNGTRTLPKKSSGGTWSLSQTSSSNDPVSRVSRETATWQSKFQVGFRVFLMTLEVISRSSNRTIT